MRQQAVPDPESRSRAPVTRSLANIMVAVAGAFVSVLGHAAEAQRPNISLWVPVAFGIGVGCFFALRFEPSLMLLWAGAGAGCLSLICYLRLYRLPLVMFLGLGCLGFAHAGWRAHSVAGVVITAPTMAVFEGRVIAIDRSASGARRLTLDQVRLPGRGPEATPRRIRVSFQGYIGKGVTVPGARVTGRARFSPPSPPVEPGGYDFRRAAWFSGLGALGYSRDPVLLQRPPTGWRLQDAILSVRLAVSAAIQSRLEGQAGAFSAAIVTGDRSALDPLALASLRQSNLAHLLAISGLHMGLLTGLVFAAMRFGIALVPGLALRIPAKKWAAGAALLAGFGYLALSGATIATQRAFVMAAVMLIAVWFDRRAISLRSVAIAACIVLMIRPEALLSPGFQMSFAATTALVGAFEALRANAMWKRTGQGWLRFFKPAFAVVVTSSVAGMATAPYSAFHFNQLSAYGLVANVTAVPVMGMVVAPSAIVAGLLAPLGLADIALAVMGAGVDYILWVAGEVSSWPGATTPVPSTGSISIGLVTLGGLILILGIGWLRLGGVLPLVVAIGLWSMSERADVLISADGRLIGVLGPAGRDLSNDRNNRFSSRIWLENDGDPTDLPNAARRGGWRKLGDILRYDGEGPSVALALKTEDLRAACHETDVLVAPKIIDPPPGRCRFLGQTALADHGAMALRFDPDAPGGVILKGVFDHSGRRLWTPK